ncbi:MAG TPA: amidohydrolase family protein [Candidatus Limnocylindrales bacterium]|nr:amidohydrolase family protein [Candidatus Limnocylindrales bacterium]
MTGDILLREYAPRSMLRRPVTPVELPAHPVVDAHAHLGRTPAGGGWFDRPVRELIELLDAVGVAAIVDLDGGWGEGLRAEIEHYAAADGRVAVFAGIDYDGFALDDEFGEREAARLRDGAAAGARGLKIWKRLGLRARDQLGRLVAVDDPRLEPLWSTAGELGLPVLIHVGDPIAFFQPLDRHNERYEELLANPDWHFWTPRPTGSADDPGFPSFDEVMAGLWHVVESHPDTTFIGAHVGCAAEDLDWVSAMLDACPNYAVDLAARLGEIGRQPYTAREFFIRQQDRIVFGTDGDPDPGEYRRWYRFLETRDESFDYGRDKVPAQGRWQIHGIGLPDDVLRKVYGENAARLLGLSI